MAITIPIISEFNSKGIKKAVKEFKQLEGAGAKASFAIKKAAVPAAAALAGIATAAVAFGKAAAEDQLAADQLAVSLKNSTGATEAQIKSVEDWIASTSAATATADDDLRPALAKLTRATKDVTRAQELLGVGQDIAAATGKDLESVSTALAKAELGNYNALKKLGIPLGENTLALIDMAKESKAVAKAQGEYDALVKGGASQKEVAKAAEKLTKAQEKLNGVTVEGADFAKDLSKQFKGANKTFADSAAGGFAKLDIALNETKESIGSALLPVIQAALPILQGFAQWAQKNPGTFKIIAAAIAGIAASIMLVNAAMALNPIGLIVIGIGALITAVALAYNKFEGFRKVVKTVFSAIAAYIKFMIGVWIKGINLVIKGLNLVPGVNISEIGNPFESKQVFPGAGATGNETGGAFERRTRSGVSGFSLPSVAVGANRTASSNITVHVNGADPNAVVGALRKYVRQTGSVPIRTAPIG